MKISDIIKTEAKYIVPHLGARRQRDGYKAVVDCFGGGFRRDGATREEAMQATAGAIKQQAEYMYARQYFFADDGTVFALHYCDGWGYDIVRAKSQRTPCTAMLGVESKQGAIEQVESHVRQYNEGLQPATLDSRDAPAPVAVRT